MVIDIPTDRDLVMLATYRTGSTAFLELVARHHGLTNLDEALHPTKSTNWFKLQYRSYSAIKIMPDHVSHPDSNRLLNDSYVISISRRDVVAQITSLYIAGITQMWHRKSSDHPSQSYTVKLERDIMENEIRYITKMNQEQNDLIKKFSTCHFYYEDLLECLSSTSFRPMYSPSNHEQIYQWIKNWMLQNDFPVYGTTEL